MAASATIADTTIVENRVDMPLAPTVSDDALSAPLAAAACVPAVLPSAGEKSVRCLQCHPLPVPAFTVCVYSTVLRTVCLQMCWWELVLLLSTSLRPSATALVRSCASSVRVVSIDAKERSTNMELD